MHPLQLLMLHIWICLVAAWFDFTETTQPSTPLQDTPSKGIHFNECCKMVVQLPSAWSHPPRNFAVFRRRLTRGGRAGLKAKAEEEMKKFNIQIVTSNRHLRENFKPKHGLNINNVIEIPTQRKQIQETTSTHFVLSLMAAKTMFLVTKLC